MGSDSKHRKRSRSRDRDRDRDRKRDRKDDRRDRDRDRGRDRDRDRDRSRRDDRDRRDRSRRDSPIRRKSLTPPSLIPRAKTPPEGGTGGFFVRGGVQKSTMKKSDNVDDHVFMPGDKIGEAFLTENAEKPKKTKDDKDKDKADDIEGANLDIRNAKRAANADDYQVRMLEAAHKFNQTEKSMEVKMTAARIQNGYKPGGGIRANEIKGFLNIWCNQRRLKPEYEFIERGKPPKGTFICKLKIDGFPYVADCEARTKREAQADAAWDFANKLVELGYCNKTDLPNKTMATVNNQGCVPTEWKSVLSDEMIAAAGHWTPDNCRKRLSMFCNYERISCEILNTALGPDHAKIAISELKLTLRKYGKEFYAKEQARTKKLANSLVAWSIMKQLYQADMIEAFGERMKKAADSKFLSKGIEAGHEVGNDIQQDQSMDMETGDWTLDSSRTRLHEFFLERGIDVEYNMLEIGFPPDRVYQAELQFEIEGKRYYSFYECDNKKMTQKKTAFDIVVKLYKDRKIEPNTGRRNWGDGPNGNVLGCSMYPPPQPFLNPNCTPRERDEFFCKTKLDAITPHPNHVNIVNSTLTMIEGALKSISDEMFEAKKALPGRASLPDKENRELMGVMRVGALAASTVLSGECEFMMVMMMKDKPTYQTLNSISKKLDERVPHENGYNFGIKPNYQDGGIEIWRERAPEMMILIKMTSQRWSEVEQAEEDPMLTLAQKMELKAKKEAEEAEKVAKAEAIQEAVKTEEKEEEEPVEPKIEEENENTVETEKEIKQETEETVSEPEKPVENEVEKETETVENDQTDEKESQEKTETVENGENAEKLTEENTEAEQKPENKPTETEEKAEVVEEKTEQEKEKEIEAEMEIKTDPSTSTLQLAKQDDDDAIEEGEIKMVDPSENQATEDESEKSDFERKIQVDSNVGEIKETVGPVESALCGGMQPDKLLAEVGCSLALAELRHSKWFAEVGQQIVSVVPLIRILREMCQRIRTWSVLSDYQINVLCHKALESGRMPLLPSDGIRRVLSTLAGGILLEGGLGVADPCEKQRTDTFAGLSQQDREDLTASAQHALRLLSFGVMHKILGIQPPQ